MRLLWLKADLLHPVDKGGKIRTFYMLRELMKLHHVTYLALDDGTAAPDAVDRAAEYCHELIRVGHRTSSKFSLRFFAEVAKNIGSPLPYAVEKYLSSEFGRLVAREEGKADVVVCDFLFPSVNMPDRLSRPSVLFQHNVEALIWRRHVEAQTNRLKRTFFREQWRRMTVFERQACHKFDTIVAVSTQERIIMEQEYGVPVVREIPTGVDTEYFRPSGSVKRRPYHLVFSGSMDWLPNDDAMKYFVRQVLPRIRAACPNVTMTIVGRNPFPGIMALSRADPSIHVTGRVEDVRPYLEEAAVYVIPLRIGGGTRLKVFEAMAMEKPIVSTSIGVEGLPIVNRTDALVADEPELFADAVIRLLDDPASAERMGQAAARKVRAQFGWAPVAAAFMEACELARRRWQEKHDRSDARWAGAMPATRPFSMQNNSVFPDRRLECE
ncbi:MAG TPA: glycosyltransferase [Nitrospira sp.]|nr:glycosyltransferase [Nitrospira sp.]